MDLFNQNGAEFSPCRKYRYALWRIWDETKPLVMFIGLNPSTANENDTTTGNDNTISKVKKIARNNGYGGLYMMNCFPLISTNPDILESFYNTENHAFEDGLNWHCIDEVAEKCLDVVFAWGNFKVVTVRSALMEKSFPDALCLHINKNGSPKHPLYCRDDSKLIPYENSKN